LSRIGSVFARAERTALIPYVTVGYPNIETTLKLVSLFAQDGCDVVELGIPFSDPLADGATIQHASYEALKDGVTPQVCIEVVEEARRQVEIPLVFMTYYNSVFRLGPERFCSMCAQAGIDGLIVPDLPPEEGADLENAARGRGIDLIYLLSPASTEQRIRLVASRSTGFIYLVSLTGVTGARDRLPDQLESFVSRVRKRTRKPLCVGFGVSTPEQARRIAKIADGVIVGSRIIQLVEEDRSLANVHAFVKSLRQALWQKEVEM